MSRVQLALNVSDLDQAVRFYSKLFGTEPAKQRSRYANFAVAEPPLKLVLFEGDGAGGTLNHLGVEVEDASDVRRARVRLADAGLAPEAEEGTECCFALQDKVWVADPDGAPWEVYTVLADSDVGADCSCSADAGEVGASGRCGGMARTGSAAERGS